jgi:hypothetical protein
VVLREDGIVETRPLPGFKGAEGLEQAKATIAAVEEISGGTRRPVLSFITDARITREARKYYSSVAVAAASAIMVRSPLQRVIANFLMGLNRLRVPTRVFTDEAEAVEWLRQYLP